MVFQAQAQTPCSVSSNKCSLFEMNSSALLGNFQWAVMLMSDSPLAYLSVSALEESLLSGGARC